MATIALVGNPNSGKTTLFNALTGATQFVGNWPGVTVERKEGKFKFEKSDTESVSLVDLPGIYSLSPYSQEEVIARDYIINEKPDVVINIVDASNIERNLYLTTQVLELGVPTIVALNMCDVVKKKGEKLDSTALAKHLGCPVVEISAIKKTGIKELKASLKSLIDKETVMQESSFAFAKDIQGAINQVRNQNFLPAEENTAYAALKILCNDSLFLSENTLDEDKLDIVKEYRKELEEKYDDDIESIVAEGRYSWINSIINSVLVKRRTEKLSVSDKIDKVITNKWAGLPIFLLVIYLVYFLCLNPKGPGKWLVGITFDLVLKVWGWIFEGLQAFGCSLWLTDFVATGIFFNIGIVIAFVPYLMLLFFFLALLEECGYMSRVAFIMDRLFRRFGLSGKSFIPMLLGSGCTVQAVASTRTIENEADRRMTIFLTPFMPCATKMPAIVLVFTILAGNAAWMAPLLYVVAIIVIILGGLFLKKFKFKGKPAPFVMELPEYKIPTPTNVGHYVWSKTVSFFKKVSTIIVVSGCIIWFFKFFTFSFTQAQQDLSDSMLATISKFLMPLFAPIGLNRWELIASLLTGMVAKDNVIGTLGSIFVGISESGAKPDAIALEALTQIFMLNGKINVPQALSFLIFFAFSSPCFSAMGAMSKELGTKKLTWQAIGFQMGSAYLLAFVVYNVLRPFFGLL